MAPTIAPWTRSSMALTTAPLYPGSTHGARSETTVSSSVSPDEDDDDIRTTQPRRSFVVGRAMTTRDAR